MDPLLLGAIVAIATILVLFSGVSVAIGLLIVSAGFLIVFDGPRSLELMPEILFGKLDNFALLSIPMFIIMGASIASTRAGADLYEALEPWLTRAAGAKVHVRNYADVLATGGSVQDFAVCTGLQLPRKLVTDKRANTSFPRAAMEIVRRGNHELVGDDVQDLKHFFLTSAFSPVPNADVEMFGDAVRADLFDRFAPIHDFLTEVNGGNRFFPYIEEMLQTRPVPEQEATRQLLEQIDPARLPGAELRAFIERLKSEHVGAAI